MNRFGLEDFAGMAGRMRRPFQADYYAMYSSVFGGIVTDPALMLVPVDDHLVHRGDGVFETFKCVGGLLYNVRAHIARLARSAEALSLRLPAPAEEIGRIAAETARAGGRRDCCVRVLVSRGPGGFSVNPYECPASQLYVIVHRLPEPFMRSHPRGARVLTSTVPLKSPVFARVKSCNYLPNAMMRKEGVDRGADFVVSFDERGFLAEGAAENVGIVSADGRLLFPGPGNILPGTTAERVMALAETLVARGGLVSVGPADIPMEAVRAAREMLIVGTTVDVAAAVEFDGKAVGDGKPGPAWRELSLLLEEDMRSNREVLTPVFE